MAHMPPGRYQGVTYFCSTAGCWVILDPVGRIAPKASSHLAEADTLALFDDARCRCVGIGRARGCVQLWQHRRSSQYTAMQRLLTSVWMQHAVGPDTCVVMGVSSSPPMHLCNLSSQKYCRSVCKRGMAIGDCHDDTHVHCCRVFDAAGAPTSSCARRLWAC